MNIITTKLYIVGEKLKNYNWKDQEDYGTSKTTTTCSKSKSAKGKAEKSTPASKGKESDAE